MSSAHRPTWAPATGKESRINTKQYSSRDIAGHTKLKFRKPGQNAAGDVSRRDLRLELEQAEREVAAKKRKAAGLPPLEEDGTKAEPRRTIQAAAGGETEDEERAKRRKLMEEALLADKDDSDDSEEDRDAGGGTPRASNGKGKEKADATGADADDDEDSDDDSDDDENETAELLRELEKIKRERAEEKERLERERAASNAVDRDEEIAVGNPLLNLRAALGQSGNASPSPSMSSTATGFAVKRRWDDDVIFKNQARNISETPKKEFVNDLLRTEFHKRFLKKFIA